MAHFAIAPKLERRSFTYMQAPTSEKSRGYPTPPGGWHDTVFAMEPRTFTGFLVAVAAVIIIAVLSYDSSRQTTATSQGLTRSIEALSQLQAMLSTLKDAETGQRGYLLTGRESYLEPFETATQALAPETAAARSLVADEPAQRHRLESLIALANVKMQELTQTVDLRRAGQADAAMELVLSDRGKDTMDRIRALSEEIQSDERQLVAERALAWRKAATFSFAVTSGGSLVLLFLIGLAAAMASRDFRARQRESWLRAGQLGLSEVMQGDLPLERLGDNVVKFLAQYLDAQAGAVFIAEGSAYRRVGGYALPPGEPALVRPGDGLAGQAVKNDGPLHVRNAPAGYLPVVSGTGEAQSAQLLIAPASVDGRAYGVVEFGFFGKVDAAKPQLLARIAEPLAAAIRASKDRTRLEELLQETQPQAEELQTREEELRVNNEELEEQSRALRESRAQLESQQAELEQINAQLEEQTQTLEHQKDALAAVARHIDGEVGRAAARQRIQERVPGQHEPRAAHAAQFHLDPRQAPGRQQGGQPQREPGEVRADHFLGGQGFADSHQRRAGSVENRGGEDRGVGRGREPRGHRRVADDDCSSRRRRRRDCNSRRPSSPERRTRSAPILSGSARS